MSSAIAYLQDEYEQEIVAMKQCLEAYIHGNPKITVFRFFLLSDQGVDEIRQACGKASLETGKRVHLISPVIPGRTRMPDTSLTINQPPTKSRNAVLQEIRVLSPQDTQVRLFMEAHEGRKPVSLEELNAWGATQTKL